MGFARQFSRVISAILIVAGASTIGLWLLFDSGLLLAVPSRAQAEEGSAQISEAMAKANWQKLLGQWREILGRMQKHYWDYRLVPPADARRIEKDWELLRQQARQLEPQLIEAAYALFRFGPRKYVDEGAFLLAVAGSYYDQDNFEEAYRLGCRLIEAGHPNPAVYALTGVAAFTLHEYDRANEYLQIADKRGVLSEGGKRVLEDLAYYRQAWEREKSLRQKEAAAGNLPRVLLVTTKGELELELFEDQAPNTVANFISLVEKKFYDGVPFHRVIPHFAAQTGDPTGTGLGGPGYRIACECYRPDYRIHFRGSVSMAHAGRDTGGSQFFICFMPQKHLDGKHTVFGRVVRGMEVLSRIARRDPEDPAPAEPDRIEQAKVLRKRDHPYRPVTLPLAEGPRR
ncbi:MAG: peptidylprolyl isomerase [Thermoguttaceae bacterium]|nr:peptidylprolyl isomerase [Thermoguttaceae bacterium]